MRSIVLYSLLFLFFLPNLFSQASLNQAIKGLANIDAMKHASMSVSVIDVESGKMIASYDPDRNLLPASSLKIVTTSMALEVLGENFKFKTELQYDGEIDADGTLNGNLYIKGYGDPTIGSHHFEAATKMGEVLTQFRTAITKVGIKKITGKIIGDASYFETGVEGRSWSYEDLGNYYGTGAWGLNFHENLYFIGFRQNTKLGSQPKIEEIEPEIPNLLLVNELKLAKAGSGDNAYIFGSAYNYTRFIRGTIPVGSKLFKVKGSIPDPPFFFAYSLMKELEANGIETSKMATSQFQQNLEEEKRSDRTTFFTFESPSLKEIVKETNLKSVNLYCESLLRTIGKKEKGEGSDVAGLKVIYERLKSRGMDTKGFFMEDGSGLSIRNAISSSHLANIMRYIAKDEKIFSAFDASLPKAAKSGALKYLLKGTIAEGRLRAKSGGMSRVRSYTGFAKTKSGKLLAFSIIANDFTGKSSVIRNKMEKIMLEICR